MTARTFLILATLGTILYSANLMAEGIYRLSHFNIKELDSVKITDGEKNAQVGAALEILERTSPDFVSINEIQFDLPNVPNAGFESRGENLDEFLEKLFDKTETESVFIPANTGVLANKKKDGTYARNSSGEDWMKLADHSNFGLFPHQYSNGIKGRFKVLSSNLITDLKWTDFNPEFNPALYKDASGTPYPSNLQLFDKSFSIVKAKLENGKIVHFVLLHTVPAFNFGNKFGFNKQRNADQILFMEAVLTGVNPYKSKVSIPSLKDKTFIAVGDWNVDWKTSELEGAKALQRLGQTYQMWRDEHTITYIGGSFRSQLDYILLSNDLEIVSGDVYSDFPKSPDLASTASDHRAISVDFRFKDSKHD